MTDATTQGPRHAHDHAGGESLGATPLAQSREASASSGGGSLLEASAGARLAGVSLLVALLWAGVYWAFH